MKNIERKVYGEKPVVDIDGDRILALPRESYGRFLNRLPGMIAGKFPLETESNGHVYRLEIDNLRTGKKPDGEYANRCMEEGKTATVPLYGTLRLYRDNHLVDKATKTIVKVPMMTETGTFILGGKEKVIKVERSEDGLRAKACGEILTDLYDNVDFSQVAMDLPAIATKRKTGRRQEPLSLAGYEMKALVGASALLNKRRTVVPANNTNPYSFLSSLTEVWFPVPEDMDKLTALIDGSEDAVAFNNKKYDLSSLLAVSLVAQKEGEKHETSGNYNLYTSIDEDGYLVVPVHPVVGGKVGESVEMIRLKDLPGIGVVSYRAPGEQVPEDETVLTYDTEPFRGGDGNETGRVISSSARGYSEARKSGKYNFVVPINPMETISAPEIALTFAMCVNTQRAALGNSQLTKSMAGSGIGPSRISPLKSTVSIAKSIKAALFCDESGTVVKSDSHEIVVETESGEKSYVLDGRLVSNSTTDLRYTPLVSQGQHVEAGQVLADGPFTRNGEIATGVPDLVAVFLPWTSASTYVNGKVVSGRGAGGTNNNDGMVIGADAVGKFSRKEIARVSVPVLSGDMMGKNGDERFDEEGLPKIGSVFGYGDTIVDKRVFNAASGISALSVIADETGMRSRQTRPELLKKNIKGKVIKVRRNDDQVEVFLEFERALEMGDKGEIGEQGQKGTFTGIEPDMPTVEIGGREMKADILLDVGSVIKRGTTVGIAGQASLALKTMDAYAAVSPEAKDIVNIAMELSREAGLPLNGMGKITIHQKIFGEEYLPRNWRPGKVRVFSPNVYLDNHEARDREAKFTPEKSGEVTLDRMATKALTGYGRAGEMPMSIIGNKTVKMDEDVATVLKSEGIRVIRKTEGLHR